MKDVKLIAICYLCILFGDLIRPVFDNVNFFIEDFAMFLAGILCGFLCCKLDKPKKGNLKL